MVGNGRHSESGLTANWSHLEKIPSLEKIRLAESRLPLWPAKRCSRNFGQHFASASDWKKLYNWLKVDTEQVIHEMKRGSETQIIEVGQYVTRWIFRVISPDPESRSIVKPLSGLSILNH
jgi:hypothetical protein